MKNEYLKNGVKHIKAAILAQNEQRFQFTPPELDNVLWVIEHEGTTLLDIAFDNVGKYMFGELPFNVNLFAGAGEMRDGFNTKGEKYDSEYVRRAIYELVAQYAKNNQPTVLDEKHTARTV